MTTDLDAIELRAMRFHKLNPLHECFDSATVLALIDELRQERAKVRGLSFSLGGTQAENAALRDAIREAQIALHIHVKLSGIPFPALEDILSRALGTEKGDET